MQDDLDDALLWARSSGLVDPQRACIAGAGYGGYAALMGLVRRPALVRCGVAWGAITEPRLSFNWRIDAGFGDEGRLYNLPKLLGDPVADDAALAAVSPLARAAEIRLPLLMAFGDRDRKVPLEHGTRMRDALKALGRAPEWVVYSDGSPGDWTLENKLDWAGRVERFLARHLR